MAQTTFQLKDLQLPSNKQLSKLISIPGEPKEEIQVVVLLQRLANLQAPIEEQRSKTQSQTLVKMLSR